MQTKKSSTSRSTSTLVDTNLTKKTNDTISYIHCQINHPPSIIKNLPKYIKIRLSTNSAKADIFQEAVKPFNNVLKNNGHKEGLKYTHKGTIQNKRGKTPNDSDPPQKTEPFTNNTKENSNKERRRKITWFNPPYSKNVATNIGKKNSSHYSALASQQSTSSSKS